MKTFRPTFVSEGLPNDKEEVFFYYKGMKNLGFFHVHKNNEPSGVYEEFSTPNGLGIHKDEIDFWLKEIEVADNGKQDFNTQLGFCERKIKINYMGDLDNKIEMVGDNITKLSVWSTILFKGEKDDYFRMVIMNELKDYKSLMVALREQQRGLSQLENKFMEEHGNELEKK